MSEQIKNSEKVKAPLIKGEVIKQISNKPPKFIDHRFTKVFVNCLIDNKVKVEQKLLIDEIASDDTFLNTNNVLEYLAESDLIAENYDELEESNNRIDVVEGNLFAMQDASKYSYVGGDKNITECLNQIKKLKNLLPIIRAGIKVKVDGIINDNYFGHIDETGMADAFVEIANAQRLYGRLVALINAITAE